MYNLTALLCSQSCVSITTITFRTFPFIPHKSWHCLALILHQISIPLVLGNQLCVSIDLSILDILYKWSKTIYGSLLMASLGWQHFFKFRSCCPMHHLVHFSSSVMSDSLWPHGLQHARFPCPLPTPGACSYSHPSSWWCHPTISSSVVPYSSCLQSFLSSGSFPVSQFLAPGDKVLEFQLQHQTF